MNIFKKKHQEKPKKSQQDIDELFEKLQKMQFDNYIKQCLDAVLSEAKELNSGVMVKDKTIWHNLN